MSGAGPRRPPAPSRPAAAQPAGAQQDGPPASAGPEPAPRAGGPTEGQAGQNRVVAAAVRCGCCGDAEQRRRKTDE